MPNALYYSYTARAQTAAVTVKRADCTLIAAPDTIVLPDEIITCGNASSSGISRPTAF